MQETDLTVYVDLKTMIVWLLVVFLVASLLALIAGKVKNKVFSAGKFSWLMKYNLMCSFGWLLAFVVCMILAILKVNTLRGTFEQGGVDFKFADRSLPADGFYYGSVELKNDFEQIKKVSETMHSLIADFSNELEAANPLTPKEQDSGEVSNFFVKNWPKIQFSVAQMAQSAEAGLSSDVDECIRVIERLNHLEKRFVTTTHELARKMQQLMIFLGVITFSMVFFVRFCVRGLFNNRAKEEGKSNLGLVKRLWGLSVFGLVIVFASFVVSIATIGFANGIYATRDFLKAANFADRKNKTPLALLPKTPTMITDFFDIVSHAQNAGSISTNSFLRGALETWSTFARLKDEKDKLVQKVDDGLERSKFGSILRVQLERGFDAYTGITQVVFYTMMWVGVFGFAHSTISFLFVL